MAKKVSMGQGKSVAKQAMGKEGTASVAVACPASMAMGELVHGTIAEARISWLVAPGGEPLPLRANGW